MDQQDVAKAIREGRRTREVLLLEPQPPAKSFAQSKGQYFDLYPAVAKHIHFYLMNWIDKLPKEPGVVTAGGSVGWLRDRGMPNEWKCPFGVPGEIRKHHGVSVSITAVRCMRISKLEEIDAAGLGYVDEGDEAYRVRRLCSALVPGGIDEPLIPRRTARAQFERDWDLEHPNYTSADDPYVWVISMYAPEAMAVYLGADFRG